MPDGSFPLSSNDAKTIALEVFSRLRESFHSAAQLADRLDKQVQHLRETAFKIGANLDSKGSRQGRGLLPLGELATTCSEFANSVIRDTTNLQKQARAGLQRIEILEKGFDTLSLAEKDAQLNKIATNLNSAQKVISLYSGEFRPGISDTNPIEAFQDKLSQQVESIGIAARKLSGDEWNPLIGELEDLAVQGQEMRRSIIEQTASPFSAANSYAFSSSQLDLLNTALHNDAAKNKPSQTRDAETPANQPPAQEEAPAEQDSPATEPAAAVTAPVAPSNVPTAREETPDDLTAPEEPSNSPQERTIRETREALQDTQEAEKQGEEASEVEEVDPSNASASVEPEQQASAPVLTPSPLQPRATTSEDASEAVPPTEQDPVAASNEARTIQELRETLAEAQTETPPVKPAADATNDVSPEEAATQPAPKKRRILPVIQPGVEVSSPASTTNKADASKEEEEAEEASLAEELAAIEEQRAVQQTLQELRENAATRTTTVDAAKMAAAMQEAMDQAPTAATAATASMGAASTQVLGSSSATSFTSSSSVPSITETRRELRTVYEQHVQQQKIVDTYQTQLRTRSATLLQTAHPEVMARITATEQASGQALNATLVLSPNEQQLVQSQALADVRASFPDLQDDILSNALTAVYGLELAGLSEATKQASLAQGIGLLHAARLGRSAILTAGAAAGVLQAAQQSLTALHGFEAGITAKKARLLALTTTTNAGSSAAPGEDGGEAAELREELRAAPDTRAALQRTALNQMSALESLHQLGATTLARPLTQQQAGLLEDFLLVPTGFINAIPSPDIQGAPALMPDGSTPAAQALAAMSGQPMAMDSSSDVADQARAAAYETARLRPMARGGRTLPNRPSPAASSSTETRTSSTGTEEPLLALRASSANSRNTFLDEQRAMNQRQNAFLGLAAQEGGYEAMMGQSVNFGMNGEYAPPTMDATSAGLFGDETEDEEEQNATQATAQEQEYQRQLIEQQAQGERQRRAQNNQQLVNRLKNSGAGKRVTQQVGKQAWTLMSNPVTGSILVIVIIFWLNIRLFAGKEGSVWREPLTPGMFALTIALDLLLAFVLLLLYVIFVAPFVYLIGVFSKIHT